MTFDCYGTLIDWERGILSALEPWREAWGVAATDDALLEAYALEESSAEATQPTALYPDILREVMRGIGRRFKAPVEDADAERLARSVGEWPAFPDSADALRALQKGGVKLIITSNVDRASFAGSNQKLGVEFDAVITAEDVGSYKPALGHFERARDVIEGMDIPREHWLHVAQSLYHDHAPAKSLGLQSAWIDRRGQSKGAAGGGATLGVEAGTTPPDHVFDSMASLVNAWRPTECAT